MILVRVLEHLHPQWSTWLDSLMVQSCHATAADAAGRCNSIAGGEYENDREWPPNALQR
jgi:hypothetical protein